jgi:hypothetical protein
MSRRITLMVVVCLAVLVSRRLDAASPAEPDMTARVDALLARAWTDNEVEPAPRTTDAEFLRRAWIDLCGIIPPINDNDGISGIHSFLRHEGANKRARLIEALLKKPTHATHFANVWKNALLPPDVNVRRFGGDNGFQTWLRGQFADNVPYDRMVSALLLANGNANQTGPALFYTALQLKPEDLAASTSRILLGTQIQCAQCHDHPFDHWKRKDFWGYAAFYARLQRATGNQQVTFQVADTQTGEVKIPGSDEVIQPAFLGGELSPDESGTNRRARLAQWLTSKENAWFAQATVNRVWAIMFGRGIVDPVDDMGAHNPPSHPELLDELSEYFVATGFNLNGLIRTLAATQAWQLSSRSTPGVESDPADENPALFARMAIKSLTAEQLYDCLAEAMRKREATAQPQNRFTGRGFDQNRQTFLAKFRAPTQGATDYEAGIPQALTLMNGATIQQATDLSQSDLLQALDAPFFTNERRVEVLFLSTLSRMPHDDERKKLVEYVENGGATENSREALSDILWALLNSAEFVLNH